jgi:tetratricopeptide (TPR) repeat protein
MLHNYKKEECFLEGRHIMKTKSRLWVALGGFVLVSALLLAQTPDIPLLEKYKALAPIIEKAKTCFLKGDQAQCEKQLMECLGKLPEHHEAHFILSQLLYKRGAFDRALDHILAAESGYVRFDAMIRRLQEERLKRTMEKKDEMMGVVDQLLKDNEAAKDRGSCQSVFYQSRYQQGVHELEQAEKDTKENMGIASLPVPAEYHYVHGNCLFRLRRYPEAENKYLAAIQSDPRCGPAYINLLNLYYIQKQFAQAKSVLERAEANQVAVPAELKKAIVRGQNP